MILPSTFFLKKMEIFNLLETFYFYSSITTEIYIGNKDRCVESTKKTRKLYYDFGVPYMQQLRLCVALGSLFTSVVRCLRVCVSGSKIALRPFGKDESYEHGSKKIDRTFI